MAKPAGKNAFFFIIVTVFIDMMAFAVIMPSMPELMAELLNGKDALFDAKALAAAGTAGGLGACDSKATVCARASPPASAEQTSATSVLCNFMVPPR